MFKKITNKLTKYVCEKEAKFSNLLMKAFMIIFIVTKEEKQ